MRPGMNVGEMHIGPHRHLSLGQNRQLALGTAALQAGDAVKDFQNDRRSSTVGSTGHGAQRVYPTARRLLRANARTG